jgi:hypothetical protein
MGKNNRLRLAPNRPPVFSVFESTGIFDERIYWARPCYAKAGSTIWLSTIDGPPALPEAPAFISWPYGDSDAWAFGIGTGLGADHWKEAGGWWELVFLNICLYSSGREILTFEEVVDMRSVKAKYSYFSNKASVFQSIIDFVSKLGANTILAESIMSDANQAKVEAEGDYMERSYEEADGKMGDAFQLIEQAMGEAQRAKDSALFWIYIAEWLVTTSAALVSGVVLWWLMVRRRLYRQVTTTQLRHL